MAKSKTSSYILTLPLNAEKYQEDELNKRFEKCRNQLSKSLSSRCVYDDCFDDYTRKAESPLF